MVQTLKMWVGLSRVDVLLTVLGFGAVTALCAAFDLNEAGTPNTLHGPGT